MKKIMTAMVLALTATTATADWLQYQHKDWKVWLVDSDELYCSANVYLNDIGFAVNGHADGTFSLQFQDDEWELGSDPIYIDAVAFRIDRRQGWEGEGVAYDSSIFIDDVKNEVIMEIAKGRSIYLLNKRDEWTHRFTLNGSQRAIRAMIDCMERL